MHVNSRRCCIAHACFAYISGWEGGYITEGMGGEAEEAWGGIPGEGDRD